MTEMYTTTMKLMLLAMAIAAVSGAASLAEEEAPAQGRGRFLASFDEQLPISARRHLNALSNINLCGTGNRDQCQERFGRFWQRPLCCSIGMGSSRCFDAGSDRNRCGSCTNNCGFGQICCNGTCATLKSDPNNCGRCGVVCRGVPCVNFMCGYNGKTF